MAEYTAESKNVKISPRKARLVAEGVKNMELKTMLAQLSVLSMRAAVPIKKTVESAIANAVNNAKVSRDNLTVKEIIVNEGIMYKRYHYAARGRIRPYKKRTSHIRVVLTEKAPTIVEKVIKNEKVEEKVKEAKHGSKS